MSCEDSKRARHRQRQAMTRAANASGCPFWLVLSARAASRIHGARSFFVTRLWI
jgi:hypothetical protein